MKSKATTVEEYLAELPEKRCEAIESIRKVILKNLPKGYEEGMQYGMISYFVPHRVYPSGYHCDPRQPLPFMSLASQRHHLSIYFMCIYGSPEDEAWFREAWAKSGKKLDMGKSCVRFKKIEDVPLQVVGQLVKRFPTKKYIEFYEASIKGLLDRRSGKGKATTKTAKSNASTSRAAKKASPRMKPSKKVVSSTPKATKAKRTAKKSTIRKNVAKRRRRISG